jgi:hypothetical protein
MLITVAAQSKAWTVFPHTVTGIMGSNPTQGKQVAASRQTDPLSNPPSMYRITKLKKWPESNEGCGAIDEWMNICWICSNFIYGKAAFPNIFNSADHMMITILASSYFVTHFIWSFCGIFCRVLSVWGQSDRLSSKLISKIIFSIYDTSSLIKVIIETS